MAENALELINNITRLEVSDDVKLCLMDCVKLALGAYEENRKVNEQIKSFIALTECYLADAKRIMTSRDNDSKNYGQEGAN